MTTSDVVAWAGWLVAAVVVGLFGAWARRQRAAAPGPGPASGPNEAARAAREALGSSATAALERAGDEVEAARAELEAGEAARAEVVEATTEALDERSRAFAARKRGEGKGPLSVALALAVTAPCARAQAIDVERMRHPRTGEEGLWVADWLWREALGDAESLPHCMRALDHAEKAVASAREAAERLVEVERVATAERAESAKRLEVADSRARAAAHALGAWYRSPWVGPVAFVAGVAVAFATEALASR